MEKFTTLRATTVAVPMNDVDTDLIIPAQYLTSISREGYGENLFRRLRDEQKDFPLNQEKYKDAKILIGGDNFGCGSSREHAVWAILGYGFRVVIAKSFADIFSSNSGKNGLLLISLEDEIVDSLIEQSKSGDFSLEIDLEAQEIRLPEGKALPFDYDPFRKHCLLNGLDDIDYILSYQESIKTFREEQDGS